MPRLVFPYPACFVLLGAFVPCSMAASCTCEENKRDDIISYNFPSFPLDSAKDLAILRDAGMAMGALMLTPDRERTTGTAGSVLLPSPITLWGVDSNGVKHDASFNTSFTMNLYRADRMKQGDGLAFAIVPSLDGPQPGSEGGFLGLTNTTSKSTAASGRFVAVEFDTSKNVYDPDDNHIGLNIGSVVSDYVVSLSSLPRPHNITLAPLMETVDYTVWIDYNGVGHHVWVYVAVNGLPKPDKAYLDAPLNMSNHVPRRAYVGFTASTGEGYEIHSILSWNLTVEKHPDYRAVRQWKVVLPAVLGSVAAAVMISVAAFYFNSRYKALKMELKLSEALRRLPGTPKEFKYATIRKATNNYDEARKLGRGGFGAVYRGTLRLRSDKTCQVAEVAVKKFTRNPDQCYDDFLAEVDVINRLRHRNIVPLVGWCYEKGQLLLIYEYMPNGSVDQHLFEENPQLQRRILGWNTRYDIIMDVAAGLHYVHHEHEHMVLHRDVKASNIMLDSSFRGLLGDFGLARIVTLNKNSYTDAGVAGTWGFIAPEYSVCHKATRKTDVYAFGVLVLEIVTGERALAASHDHETLQPLTDWVWWVHREGRLLQAVDDRVISTQEFDADDAIRLLLLGLACSNPNASDRPSMAEVVQVLAKSAAPPEVPLMKPTFVWPPEGGIPMEFDDMTATSSLDWEDTSSSEALGSSVPSEINKRKPRVGGPKKSRSAEEYYV